MLVATILLAVALSLDGLGVGLSYGLRQIRLPWPSLALVALITVAVSFLSMVTGKAAINIFSPELTGRLGAVILLALGLAILVEAYLKQDKHLTPERTLVKFCLPRFGLAVQILKEPVEADWDKSGTISSHESLALGIALALDTAGVGFGAAAAGFSLVLVPLFTGTCLFIMVAAGMYLGGRCRLEWITRKGAAIPGLILIALGIWRW